jgi:hypothetical protein
MQKNKSLLGLFVIVFLMVLFVKNTPAQDVPISGLALTVNITDPNAKNGDIVCGHKTGYVLCSGSYDSGMYGVINDSPIGSVEMEGQGKLVNTSGNVKVNISSANGDIKKGNFITSSLTPGVGQLAIRNGYVLGIAMEDYSNTDKKAVGQILVSISIHPTIDISDYQTDLIATIKEALLTGQVSPLATLRYLTAALMVILGFGLGFIYFGRIAKAGVEAIGRNPLSARTIQLGLVLHILLTIVIIVGGLGIGYLILTL